MECGEGEKALHLLKNILSIAYSRLAERHLSMMIRMIARLNTLFFHVSLQGSFRRESSAQAYGSLDLKKTQTYRRIENFEIEWSYGFSFLFIRWCCYACFQLCHEAIDIVRPLYFYMGTTEIIGRIGLCQSLSQERTDRYLDILYDSSDLCIVVGRKCFTLFSQYFQGFSQTPHAIGEYREIIGEYRSRMGIPERLHDTISDLKTGTLHNV